MESVDGLFSALGLSPKEARIYLSLVKEGPSSVRQLAAATHINRGTVYDGLKVLQANGLVRFYNAETRQYFVAESPKRLQDIALERQEALQAVTEGISEFVSELESFYDAGDRQPIARMYEGTDGVRTILEDVLSTMSSQPDEEREYYVYSSSAVRDAGLYSEIPDFTKRRIALGIRDKNISIGSRGPVSGLDERRYVDSHAGAPTYVLLYHGKVANIFLDHHGEFVGFIVENQSMYAMQRLIFDELWERLPAENV